MSSFNRSISFFNSVLCTTIINSLSFFFSSSHFSFLSLVLFVSHNTIIMQAYVFNAFILNVVCFRFQYKPIHIHFFSIVVVFFSVSALSIFVFIFCCFPHSTVVPGLALVVVNCCVFSVFLLWISILWWRIQFVCIFYAVYVVYDRTKTVSSSRLSISV